VLGPVTSQRRHFIIDGITIAIGLAKELRLERIIDVGCHTGITTNLISLELQRRVLGIDPSVAAINYARSQVRSAAEFAVASIPFEGREQFDLAVVIDSLSEDAADVEGFLRGLGSILVPDGIAIVVSQYWVSARPAHIRQQLRAAGFGVGYADVVGGLGSIPLEFATEGVVVLVKAGGRRYPENWRAWMESEWHRFREYANSASTPLREKTQAFERACRKHLMNKGIDGRVGVSES
jgi:SAM-dependent methyltransferase